MSNERIVRRSLSDRKTRETNWAKFDALTDQDIVKAASEDPDAAPVSEKDWWKDAELISPPQKHLISIRVDKEVLEFFKAQGRGYQTKMNSVLKSYVNAHK